MNIWKFSSCVNFANVNAFQFTEFYLHIACQITVVAFLVSAYNGCCNVSTYRDTDKRKTAVWTKVSHKCKLVRHVLLSETEVL